MPRIPKTPKTTLLKTNQAFDVLQGGSSRQPTNMSVAPNMSVNTPAPQSVAQAPSPTTPTPTSPTPEVVSPSNTLLDAAKAFKAQYGRNPLTEELSAFRAGTFVENPTPAFPSGNIGSSIVQDPGAEKAAREAQIANARATADATLNRTPAGFTEGTFGQGDVGQQILERLNQLTLGGDNLDEAAIREAGAAAAAQFDPLILQAEQSAEQGRGKNLARAAATGQLDATAIAGIAALTGNENVGLEDGKKFEGSGGILSRLGAEYDLEISKLQAAQISARRAAEEAERTFQRTGRQEDFNRALQLYETSRDAFNEQNTLAEQKQVAMQRAVQTALSQQTLSFGAEDRILGQIAPTLVGIGPDGEIERADDATIAKMAAQYGISFEALGAAINNQIDELASVQSEERQAYLDQQKTLAEIGATGALQQQREASAIKTETMLPLEQQLKQAQIASQQASAARSRQLIQKANSTPDEFDINEGVELLRLTGSTKELPGDDDYKTDVLLQFSKTLPQTKEELRAQNEREAISAINEQAGGGMSQVVDPYTILSEDQLSQFGLTEAALDQQFSDITTGYSNLFGGIYGNSDLF